mmetsp:Transcript_26460/g.57730  ORF Transcript_26460/g.57730 Transcript_26460/m.57730 type:complete len:641 (+) Transcript_26460:134-2056(+)
MRPLISAVAVALVFFTTGISADTLPFIATKPMRYVCVSDYWPISSCADGDAASGYEPELFRRVAANLANRGFREWAPGNYTFVCIANWENMLDNISLPEDQRGCDVLAAGVSATNERMAQGLQFSATTYESGRRILVYSPHQPSYWSFFQPLHLDVWLLTFGTTVAVALVMFLLEVAWTAPIQAPAASWSRYSNLQWATTGLLLRGVFQLAPRSPGARVIILGFTFLVLILINLYIGAASALLTARELEPKVRCLEDLVTLPMGVYDGDAPNLDKLPVHYQVPLPWANGPDERRMLSLLRNRTLNALLLDAPWVEYMAATNCDLETVGDLVLPVSFGFVFPKGTPSSYILSFDVALSDMERNGVMEQLKRQYIYPITSCTDNVGSQSMAFTFESEAQITLNEVAGLWIILAACVGLGMLWNGALLVWRYWRQHAKPTARDAESSEPVSELGLPAPKLKPSEEWIPVADAATLEESVQMVDARLRQVDYDMKHVPFVIAATMDAKLGELKTELLASILREIRSLPAPQSQGQASKGSAQEPAKRLEDHFPELANRPPTMLQSLATDNSSAGTMNASMHNGTAAQHGGPSHPSSSLHNKAAAAEDASVRRRGSALGLPGNGLTAELPPASATSSESKGPQHS